MQALFIGVERASGCAPPLVVCMSTMTSGAEAPRATSVAAVLTVRATLLKRQRNWPTQPESSEAQTDHVPR